MWLHIVYALNEASSGRRLEEPLAASSQIGTTSSLRHTRGFIFSMIITLLCIIIPLVLL